MGSYVPNTKKEQQEMLASMGYSSIEELFSAIPEEVRMKKPLDIPDGLSEMEVRNKLTRIAEKNKVFRSIFRGCGAYNHYIPSLVKQITSKEEFVTAYTPYQAEISQGTLQAIFEFQTMICELTGMDAANASVYDGATAAAEAVIMCREKKRNKAVISGAVNKEIIETVKTYLHGTGMEVIVVPELDGRTDILALEDASGEETSCILLQQPNYYGQLEDLDSVKKIADKSGAKFIISCNPVSLGILKTPGEYGADIAVGEGQPLGLPLSFGGPYLGFMAATDNMKRKLPGRIVGETKDVQGRRAFVLTLQAREQHIRREKASSNICSNQALCALTASVYLSTMGRKGLEQAAVLSMSKAHYLAERLCELEGFEMFYTGDYFNEFVTTCKGDPYRLMNKLEQHGILGGYPLSGKNAGNILWCATEMNSKEDMDELIQIVREVEE
ncbi:aminomethyl-transferring glycine dehydrogenase subunit GcvPA [Anaerocolumna sedimenticola]|uniref:Probable glycine dehydrogenase (decarboxylating) subunit 1 n=1 Tax=Anaerocolumna sedimenticola TaxID=2696063 RepID=A0A6P1TKP2_9FIRM|nr:aminomethyl-transferring glycine dehydrogenase subunit GcvPA [Anaerocolumna sedimenticola]QHQ61780.1 aminomethyl-transferring glycine dehydrogenase subunit GcvPA [Anaerocolumna sedimenticola]